MFDALGDSLTVRCQYILLKLFCNSKGGNVLFRVVQD